MLCLAYRDCDARTDWELRRRGCDYDPLASVNLQKQGDLKAFMLRIAYIISFWVKRQLGLNLFYALCAYARQVDNLPPRGGQWLNVCMKMLIAVYSSTTLCKVE